jgi:chitin synthase
MSSIVDGTLAVLTEDRDINAAYEDAIVVLSSKLPKVDAPPDVATQQEDYYRQFRTKCVHSSPRPCVVR